MKVSMDYVNDNTFKVKNESNNELQKIGACGILRSCPKFSNTGKEKNRRNIK